jgi:MFS family permease
LGCDRVGVAVAAFGFAPNLGVALVLMALAGGADMISGIFRGTIWNTTIPDHLRGRLAGIEQVSYSAGPLLGNLEAGVVASLTGVRASIASGGVLCVAGVALAALALPAFRRYDAREQLDEPPGEGVKTPPAGALSRGNLGTFNEVREDRDRSEGRKQP